MLVPVFTLGKYATVFQAEVQGILESARTAKQLGKRGKLITICSDSKAALTALTAPKITSRLVGECRTALSELSEDNRVVLTWVPGHFGLKGNEKADQLAWEASARNPDGPEPVMYIPHTFVRENIQRWIQQEHCMLWRQVSSCRQAKALMGLNPDGARAREALRLDRKALLTGILTGHGGLRYHLFKTGQEVDPKCRVCGRGEETSYHVLAECEAHTSLRWRCFGTATLDPETVTTLPISAIMGFWKKTKIAGWE